MWRCRSRGFLGASGTSLVGNSAVNVSFITYYYPDDGGSTASETFPTTKLHGATIKKSTISVSMSSYAFTYLII
jgi:hypothetical protein